MDEKDSGKESSPIVIPKERRVHRNEDLSCEEIMKIVRQRASRKSKRIIDVE